MCLPNPTAEQPRRTGGRLLYYITDRRQFSGNAGEQTRKLLARINECARAGVDYIQLREKDLSVRELEKLAIQAMGALPVESSTRLLINSRIDVAIACGAHGVHLPANDLSASEARALWSRASQNACVIGVSAHSVDEIAMAEAHGADLAVFGPVFAKDGAANPQGLDLLERACRRSEAANPPMPVLALGGVTAQNYEQCVAAGAAGVAGIRLFQESGWEGLISMNF